MTQPSRIAVFMPNWVGDAVMATPALSALRAHFGGAQIIGVLKPYVAPVFDGLGWLDETILLDSTGPSQNRWLGVAHQLRTERVDLAILFPNSFRSALVSWWGGCKRRVGYARYARSWLLTDALTPFQDARGRLRPSPIIDAYNRLAEHVGCGTPGYAMTLATTVENERGADEVWAASGWNRNTEVVCLNPGAAFGSAKYWPEEYFAKLARLLGERRGSSVLVLCGPADRGLADQIARRAGVAHVHSLADYSTSLGLTKACVKRADLLITTDSGPRHFAAAFNRPVVTLFGPTHIDWTETYHPKAVHLQKKVACGPCQLRKCPLDHRCMTTLTPEEVFAAAQELLERVKPLSVAG